jgi:uncharacterized membrane protein
MFDNFKIGTAILIFLITGFIGWILLSIFSGQFIGYLWENYRIPFKPMFAIGAVIIYLINPYIKDYNIIIKFIIYAIILTILEWICFEFIKIFLNIRYVCYYNGKRIALVYSIYWGLLALIFSKILNNDWYNLEMIILLIVLAGISYIFRDGREGFVKLDKLSEEERKLC